MSFYNETQVKACRKAKRCHWCNQMIGIGQPKTVIATVWEGDFTASNFHPECAKALNLYNEKYGRMNDYEWPEEGSMVRGEIIDKENVQ